MDAGGAADALDAGADAVESPSVAAGKAADADDAGLQAAESL